MVETRKLKSPGLTLCVATLRPSFAPPCSTPATRTEEIAALPPAVTVTRTSPLAGSSSHSIRGSHLRSATITGAGVMAGAIDGGAAGGSCGAPCQEPTTACWNLWPLALLATTVKRNAPGRSCLTIARCLAGAPGSGRPLIRTLVTSRPSAESTDRVNAPDLSSTFQVMLGFQSSAAATTGPALCDGVTAGDEATAGGGLAATAAPQLPVTNCSYTRSSSSRTVTVNRYGPGVS